MVPSLDRDSEKLIRVAVFVIFFQNFEALCVFLMCMWFGADSKGVYLKRAC